MYSHDHSLGSAATTCTVTFQDSDIMCDWALSVSGGDDRFKDHQIMQDLSSHIPQ